MGLSLLERARRGSRQCPQRPSLARIPWKGWSASRRDALDHHVACPTLALEVRYWGRRQHNSSPAPLGVLPKNARVGRFNQTWRCAWLNRLNVEIGVGHVSRQISRSSVPPDEPVKVLPCAFLMFCQVTHSERLALFPWNEQGAQILILR